jgi:hypothetical protein
VVYFGWNICNCTTETTRIDILVLLFYIRYTYNNMPEAAPIRYNSELEQLLKENSEECESLSILHRISYEKYYRRSNYINIPVIILSSAIGFITGIDLQYDKMNIILGIGSVFVGIIKSVDTYFQLAKRAESHRICSLQFSQIYKKIQIELSLNRSQRASAENMMNIVKTDIKNMQDIAPLIDDDIVSQYNEKYRRYKKVKKPNFVNGLTEVKINSAEDDVEYASRQGSREQSPERGGDTHNQSTDNNANSSTTNIGGNSAYLVENSIEPSHNSHNSHSSRNNSNNTLLNPPTLPPPTLPPPPNLTNDTRIIITPSRSSTPNVSIPNTPNRSQSPNAVANSGMIRTDSNGNQTLSA